MSLSKRVLKSLELACDLLDEVDSLKYLPYNLIWGTNLQGYNRASVQAVISRLNKRGYLKKKIDQGKVYLALTDLGKSFLDKNQNRPSLQLNKDTKTWDKLYRFVCFDIPESDRLIRDQIRSALKASGAVCWQRSIWVTKENITRELNAFIEQNNLEDYCTILEVKELYNQKLKSLLEVN